MFAPPLHHSSLKARSFFNYSRKSSFFIKHRQSLAARVKTACEAQAPLQNRISDQCLCCGLTFDPELRHMQAQAYMEMFLSCLGLCTVTVSEAKLPTHENTSTKRHLGDILIRWATSTGAFQHVGAAALIQAPSGSTKMHENIYREKVMMGTERFNTHTSQLSAICDESWCIWKVDLSGGFFQETKEACSTF